MSARSSKCKNIIKKNIVTIAFIKIKVKLLSHIPLKKRILKHYLSLKVVHKENSGNQNLNCFTPDRGDVVPHRDSAAPERLQDLRGATGDAVSLGHLHCEQEQEAAYHGVELHRG